MPDFEKLTEALGNLDEIAVTSLLDAVMTDGGTRAGEALAACQKGMDVVGERFEVRDYFVSELIFAGELMTRAVNVLKPALAESGGARLGKMILCTVENDMHDIGKNIVKAVLEAGGFEVVDLGIDTPAEKVVETAKAGGIEIIALSGVLTLAVPSMEKTITAIRNAGLRAKVIIGGCPVNEDVCRSVGADAWASNPQDGARICREWATA